MHLAEANAYVAMHHRHSRPVLSARFSIGITDGEAIRGVAICGRPVARSLQDGWTLEVNRLATDGATNGCSMLYGACWRAAVALGYNRLVTYTLDVEGGASLRASGWTRVAELPARAGWDADSRPRDNDLYLSSDRVRWEKGKPTPDGPPPTIEVPDALSGQMELLQMEAQT